MENPDTNELIESFLNGSLTPAQQEAVEARLAGDSAFQAEVELHRQLHEELADPQKLQLRDLLTDIVRQPPPPVGSGWVKGGAIALVILLGGWLGWRWLSPGAAPAPVEQEEMIPAPPPSEPVASPEPRTAPSATAEKKTEGPIAMADPAAFEPDREFEDRLGGNLRASGGSAEMQSPAIGAALTLKSGLVKIDFKGTAPADADTTVNPLILKIYNNQPAPEKPLFSVLPSVSKNTATDEWTFSSSQRLRLRPGLYYFTVERRADEDLIFVGKFTVGAR